MVAILLFGCKKEEEPKTTYVVINDSEKFESGFEYLDGTLWEVVVYCFIGEDVVREDILSPIAYGGGTSEIMEVPDNFEKIKVSFKMLPKESSYYDMSGNVRKYTVTSFLLTPGIDNQIVITGQTTVSSYLKSASVLQGENTFLTNLQKFKP